MFLQVWKVGFDSLLLGLARGEKNWKSSCLKSWTRNTESNLVSKIGKKWPFALFNLFFIFSWFVSAWKCFRWCYIHLWTIPYYLVESHKSIHAFIKSSHTHMHSFGFYLIKVFLTLILVIGVWWSLFHIFGMLQTFPP